VSQVDNRAHRQTVMRAQSTHGCKSAANPNFSWIKLREQKWFCGWIWGVDTERFNNLQSYSTSSVIVSSKPVTVNELACKLSMKHPSHTQLMPLQHMLALLYRCRPKLRSPKPTSRSYLTACRCHVHISYFLRYDHSFLRRQNFSNRMEQQAVTSALATPNCTRLATVAKRVAFLSDLPDDVILKCAIPLTHFSCLFPPEHVCHQAFLF
jgi:hypothetical protein